jgi:hypothetical protein
MVLKLHLIFDVVKAKLITIYKIIIKINNIYQKKTNQPLYNYQT